MVLELAISIISIITGAPAEMQEFLAANGYGAIVLLMTLESASLPVPSEIVLPLIGLYVYKGMLNLYLAIGATMLGTFFGISIDYWIAYFLGKDVVYKNAQMFHIKKESLEHFDKWFNKNAGFTIFVARLIPIVRGLISFPAGFAQMDLKRFYLYSLAGSLIWNVILIEFGYYTFGPANSIVVIFAVLAVLAELMYLIYQRFLKRVKNENIKAEKEIK